MLQHLVDLPRLQHLHEGEGSARRALHHQPHLRHLRRQPRDLFVLRAADGVRRASARARRVDRQPRRGRRVHVRSQHLPGEPRRRRLLRKDGEGDQSGRLGQGAEDGSASCRRSRLSDDRRHHALAQSVRGGVLPRGARHEPSHPRDVLPDGGAARAPVHALSRRRRDDGDDSDVHRLPRAADEVRRVHEARRADARRPLRLLLPGASGLREGRAAAHSARLLGRVPGSGRVQLPLPGHDRAGAARCSSRPASSSTGSW